MTIKALFLVTRRTEGIKRRSRGAQNGQIVNICNQLNNGHLTVYNMTMVKKKLFLVVRGSKGGSKGGPWGRKCLNHLIFGFHSQYTSYDI